MKEILLGDVQKDSETKDRQLGFVAHGLLGDLRTTQSPLDPARKMAIVTVHDSVNSGEPEAWIDFGQGDFETDEEAAAIIMRGLEQLSAAGLLPEDTTESIASQLVGQETGAGID